MSMGRPAPEYGVHVVDEAGHDVAPGETGELRIAGVRGVSLFAEYLDDPEATAAAFDAEGRLRTGDRVRLAHDGFLYFADRTKDMLKVGGENVAASEVERIIAQVPGVVECAVVGRPDPMLVEVPVAFVIAAPGLDFEALSAAVRSACRERLADFKVPREIAFVDEFPRATLNKVAKAELRVRAAELGAHALHRRSE
jgi:crotonobetaine/carnitine-CoA ligase